MFYQFLVHFSWRFAFGFLFLLMNGEPSAAQSFINPSFEGEPQEAFVPVGWTPCSPQTTPDIFPGVWGVNMDPAEGDTYLGLITRADGSNESIGQRIPITLEKDRCYTFSFFLNASDTYAGFNQAIQCRLWLGSSSCQREQLIFESEPISSPYWKKRSIRFYPDKKHKFLIIEAGFPTSDQKARGNILLDGLSQILPCDRT